MTRISKMQKIMPKLSDSIEFLQKIIASLFEDKVSQPWNKLFFSKIQKKNQNVSISKERLKRISVPWINKRETVEVRI